MAWIEEEQSFSLTANVLSPGPVSIVPSGYIVSRRSNGVYVAPLIPQLFLGASGGQLSTWSQWIPSAGSQVILTKPAGELLVPREELYWRKVTEPAMEAMEAVPKEAVEEVRLQEPSGLLTIFVIGVLASLVAGYAIAKTRRK